MTRTMGDAIHGNVAALAAHPGLQLVGGYVTGSADIKWTDADWARFPGQVHITIDQGFTGSPVPAAIVRDVEPGAWTPAAAVNRAGWNTPRPTIYCDRNDLSREGGVLQSGWRGDLWLAYPGWQPGVPLPTAPGCTYVAVQNQLSVGNAYDLSVVLDDTWPVGAAPVPAPPASTWQENMMRQLPVLGQGATGADVRTVQGLCCARGHSVTIDGIYGPLTKGAVIAVQRAAGFTAAQQDGVTGPQTWPVLLGV